ncbi:hypothetical protein AcW2_004113 [Taiwanofungus camphoratus]|nr:hypothetical protein AcW2_004113 [Antrodia cinnamomea]
MPLLWAILSFFAIASWAKSSTGDSVLVVLEPSLKRDNFSIFFNGLEEKGYDLTFRAPKDVRPPVVTDDQPQFSHVILFAPESKSYSQDLTPQSLVSLLSQNTNLLLALSPKQTPLTSLAAEFSLILPPPGTPLVSHFPERDTPATVIPVSVPSSHPVLTSNLPPVWFSGVPFAYGSNPLLVPILNAPPESFAADSDRDSGADAIFDSAEKGGEGLWAGSSLGLVAGFQALGGARVTWVGGIELFSDDFANKEIAKGIKSGNAQFAADVATWTFQESSVLRIDSVMHHRVNETHPRDTYTTNDHVVCQVTRWIPVATHCVPPTTDLYCAHLKIQPGNVHMGALLQHSGRAAGIYYARPTYPHGTPACRW